MSQKRKFAIALAVFAAVALIVGLTTLAATTYGTKSDPLVTLSYINGKATTDINAAIEDSISASEKNLTSSFEAQVAGYESKLAGASSGTYSTADNFTLVTLNNGQTMTCGVGTEVLLRVGSAVSAGKNSPMLVNETDGTSFTAAGKELVKNNMYMVTIQKNGIKATANGTKVLVKGNYTVS